MTPLGVGIALLGNHPCVFRFVFLFGARRATLYSSYTGLYTRFGLIVNVAEKNFFLAEDNLTIAPNNP